MPAACGDHMTHEVLYLLDTQVWKSTTSLGCVVSPCARGPVHVCVYYPPGNIAGQVTKNVFEPTS